MQFLKSLLTYFFRVVPLEPFNYYIPLSILAIALIIGGVVFSNYYQKKKKEDIAFKILFRKLSRRMVIFGIIFIFLILIRYERIPYFAMRIWMYLVILLFAYFAYKTIKAFRVEYPKQKHSIIKPIHKHKNEEMKYLPNKKRR